MNRIRECIFPTHVGVNRILAPQIHQRSNFPHARGGEPKSTIVFSETLRVFQPFLVHAVPEAQGIDKTKRGLG